jgi:hypothetical protein
MSGGITQTIVIDERLDSYKTFFDHAWAENIGKLAATTKLKSPVFNLRVNWKAAANTCVVPWLICTTVSGFSTGFAMGREPFAVQMIDACAKRLPDEMPSLTNMRRKELGAAVRKIGTELMDLLAQQAQEFTVDANEMWTSLLNGAAQFEFRLSIWGSQRISYGAIYHTYEDFVRECIRLALGRTKYKPRGGITALVADAGQQFGPQLADDCLNAQEMKIARLVRNSLAHSGGKETDELKKIQHGILVEDDVLQIMAPDTRRLFHLLKERAYKLVEKAITLPNMK